MPKLSKIARSNKEKSNKGISTRWKSKDLICLKNTRPTSKEENQFDGLCLVDFAHFWKEIQNFQHNPGFSCATNEIDFDRGIRHGLQTTLIFRCRTCKSKKQVAAVPNKPGNPNVNFLSVLGASSIGCGFSQLNEYHAVMNIPYMTYKMYRQEENDIKKITTEVLQKNIAKVGQEEAQKSIDTGDVDQNGIPTTTVMTDGAWSKRSYRTNYNAPSGVGTIVGVRTKKILNIEVLNKYCAICNIVSEKERKNNHRCFKNFNGNSTAMEAAAIVKGFKKSITQHNLKYIRIVSDGDSSVMKKLREIKPYGPTTNIEKVECTNHLLRNFCNKLSELGKSGKSSSNLRVPLEIRNLLTSNILRLRTAVKLASIKREGENISLAEKTFLLSNDIKNAPYHVFGNHINCAKYFCKGPKADERNMVEEMKECGLFQDIMKCITRLVQNSHSLLLQETTNNVESFNSVICKVTGGKRINFAKSESYKMRCELAALSFNTKGKQVLEILNIAFQEGCPSTLKTFYETRDRKLNYCKKNKRLKKIQQQAGPDENYGTFEEVDEEEFSKRKEDFYNSLRKTTEEINHLEKLTRGQSANPIWKRERQNRITASRFGEICKRRPSTYPGKLAERLLFSGFSGSRATAYGLQHEDDAIEAFSQKTGLAVTKCGFFIGKEDDFFLGASPDGILENQDSLIEVKCPANLEGISTEDLRNNLSKVPFLHVDRTTDQLRLKRNHNYFYQVQGQLHITGRKSCYFVVWSNIGSIFVENILRDDHFWEEKCKNQLKKFYEEHLLPKILC